MGEIVININDIQGFSMSSVIRKTMDQDQDAPKMYEKKSRRKDGKDIVLETSAFKYSNRLAVQGNKKKPRKVTTVTTDVLYQHQAKMKYFQELQNSLPTLREQLQSTTDTKIRDRLRDCIEDIEMRREETDYYMKTFEIINKYTELLDREDDVVEQNYDKADTTGFITKFIGKYDNVEKQKLIDRYNQIMNNGQINIKSLAINISACKECEGVLVNQDGYLVCEQCGTVSLDGALDMQVSYKDMVDTCVRVPFSYKKVNRFNECLATVQAKENTEIPDYVLHAVKVEINKEKNVDISKLDTKRIRYYLRRLSLTSYYDHSASILSKINGVPPTNIPKDVEEQLRSMFQQILEPFEVVKRQVCKTRISFLSYKFVLYKLFELLGMHEHLHHFPLLKSIDKLKLHDRIWKGICEMLDWEYVPSI